jgi:hypothetical protein
LTKLKYDVYIAGSMHGRKVQDVLLERTLAKNFCKLYGLTYYCPASDEGLDKKQRDDIIDLVPNLNTMESYVKKDDDNLDKCRVLLVLTGDKSSSGTAWEMARMHYKNKRQIVLVANKMWYGKLVNFTTIKANYIRPTIESAIKSIANILHGG